jgi:hypothetical protein
MNLKDTFSGVENYFSPRIIGEVNDQYIKIVKIKGQEVPWHNHKNEDELFYIAEGTLPSLCCIPRAVATKMQTITSRILL